MLEKPNLMNKTSTHYIPYPEMPIFDASMTRVSKYSLHVYVVARVVNAKSTIVSFMMKLLNPHVIFHFHSKSLGNNG